MELVELVLQSIDKYSSEEMVQTNACILLRVIDSPAQVVKSLVRRSNGTWLLKLASEKFPQSCKELVDEMGCGWAN